MSILALKKLELVQEFKSRSFYRPDKKLLLEFVTEESKLGMREIECFEMIEKIFLCSNKGEIPKKDIVNIYKSA